ncbi:MAG TPA: hypothetical protein VNS31_03270 [Ramlibacter sp.]|jgi:hypothetical protein|nr:hypothetical protein [Ramlibacter sp.]
MYENAHRLFLGLTNADVLAKHPAGVCSSFAMDWLKKKAAAKVVSAATYTVDNGAWNHTSRLNKIVARQKKYEKSGDLALEAKSYGLLYTERKSFYERFAGDIAAEFAPYDQNLAVGLYYLSFRMERGEGHAIGYDKGAMEFCDANQGIYRFNGENANYLVAQVRAFMLEELQHACNQVILGEVRLLPKGCF